MGEVWHGAARAQLAEGDAVVAAAGASHVRGVAGVEGTHVAQFRLRELDGGEQAPMLGPEGAGRLEIMQVLGEGGGLGFEFLQRGFDGGVPLGTVGDWVVSGGQLVGEVRDVLLEVGHELLVASLLEVQSVHELGVDFKAGLLGGGDDPLAVELEEVLVEGEQFAAAGGDSQPRTQCSECWSEVFILDAWSWLLRDDIGHELVVGEEVLEGKSSLGLEEMNQCLWLVLIAEGERWKESHAVAGRFGSGSHWQGECHCGRHLD